MQGLFNLKTSQDLLAKLRHDFERLDADGLDASNLQRLSRRTLQRAKRLCRSAEERRRAIRGAAAVPLTN
jgi:hypothetical protein